MNKAFFTFIIFVFVGTIAVAQDKKYRANTWAQAPFDHSVTNVGKKYQGHECLRIASSLKSKNLKKSEYETTDAFNKRIAETLADPIYGSVTKNDTLALVRKSRLEPSLKYEADDQKLIVNANISGQLIFIGQTAYSSDTLEFAHGKESNYIGGNAYGATVRVKKIESKACSIAFLWPKYDIKNPLIIEISEIEPQEAKRFKGNIDIAYIGKLTEPYIGDVFKHFTATIDSPTEITATGDAIIIKLEEIWVIDRATGNVLVKKKV